MSSLRSRLPANLSITLTTRPPDFPFVPRLPLRANPCLRRVLP